MFSVSWDTRSVWGLGGPKDGHTGLDSCHTLSQEQLFCIAFLGSHKI